MSQPDWKEENQKPGWLDQAPPTKLPPSLTEQGKKFQEFMYQRNPMAKVQTFGSGATRSSDEGKFDYEGFVHPSVLEFFGDYMNRHRKQADGNLRDSDNWQKGIPLKSYQKALVRHVLELWALWRGHIPSRVAREMPGKSRHEMFLETAGAVMFNINGLVFEYLKSDQLADVSRPENPKILGVDWAAGQDVRKVSKVSDFGYK